MCISRKISVPDEPVEDIKTAVKADASTQKSNVANRTGNKGLVSENIKTSNTGLDDEVVSAKKKLLGE